MIALDTNVVVRLLVEDEPLQCARARRLVEGAEARGEPLWLADVVWCETVWVLESCYRLPREAIAAALQRLARARQVVLQSPDQVASALASFGSGGPDFADYLILEQAKAAGCDQLATFDRRLLALDRVAEP
jgi:predicted nucleic-acid-binding protein